MQSPAPHTKRIAKNMIVLYFRMIFQMAVYLYTSRALLSALGETDFGIFDVVAGFVFIIAFLNNAMANSTLRFITFAIGTNDKAYLQRVFSTSVNIHFLLAILVVLLGETVGLWFVSQHLQFPPEHFGSAMVVYQCALVSAFMLVMSVPYNTAIIAYEKMTAFAYITILDVSLKLGIVLLITGSQDHKLETYALLLALESIIVRLIYSVYCRRSFKDMRYQFRRRDPLYAEMLSFTGWCTFGNMTVVANSHGLNVLLNLIGGPILGPLYNTARGLATQVQTALTSFIAAFQTSINPQITKTYAQGEVEQTNHLVLISSRISYLLTLFIVLPLLLDTDFYLNIWLKEVPLHTKRFTQLLLLVSTIDALSNPLMIAADATGRIKRFHILVSMPLLATLPLAYFLTRFFGHIEWAFVTLLATTLLAHGVRMILCRSLFGFSIRKYSQEVLLRIGGVTLISLMLPLLIQKFWISVPHLLLALITMIWLGIWVFTIGLRPSERQFILQKLPFR